MKRETKPVEVQIPKHLRDGQCSEQCPLIGSGSTIHCIYGQVVKDEVCGGWPVYFYTPGKKCPWYTSARIALEKKIGGK